MRSRVALDIARTSENVLHVVRRRPGRRSAGLGGLAALLFIGAVLPESAQAVQDGRDGEGPLFLASGGQLLLPAASGHVTADETTAAVVGLVAQDDAANDGDAFEDGDNTNRARFRQRIRDGERRLDSSLDADISIDVDYDSMPDDETTLAKLSESIDALISVLIDKAAAYPIASSVSVVEIKGGDMRASREGQQLSFSLPLEGAIAKQQLADLVDRAFDP